jgi:integrase
MANSRTRAARSADGPVAVAVHRNDGLRKRCDCPRAKWPKCAHDWHFNFKPRGGPAFRFSLDREVGRRLTSKEEADREADALRVQIRAGTFTRAHERREHTVADQQRQAHEAACCPGATLLRDFAETYVARVSKVRARNKSWRDDVSRLAVLAAFTRVDGTALGDVAIAAITEDDVEAFFGQLRTTRAAATRNNYVTLIKKAFRWATKKGYLARNPISEDSELKRAKPTQRARRLVPDSADADGRLTTPGEERRLLAVARPHLQSLIIGAVESCCRQGELLALQWAQVHLDRRTMQIRASTAKDNETRTLPISDRLAAVLQMLQTDPAGKPHPPEAFVFGECGQRVKTVKRAWQTAVLKAHGQTPVWTAGAKLSPASRAALKAIDLRFHDLRHEGGSRLLEEGWPLHHVQEMLGHASIEQTSTYLNVQPGGLSESMRRSNDARIRCTLLHAKRDPRPTERATATQENDAKLSVN